MVQALRGFSQEELEQLPLSGKHNTQDLLTVGLKELLTGLRHNAEQKLEFEQAKSLIAQGSVETASEILEALTTTMNIDWRVCYRALFLLWYTSKVAGLPQQAEDYKRRCLVCHPGFPEKMFNQEHTWVPVPDALLDVPLRSNG